MALDSKGKAAQGPGTSLGLLLLAAQAWPERETELEPGVSASLTATAEFSGPFCGLSDPREALAPRKAATGSPAPKPRPQKGET